ncbi:uncharacterized protein LOC144158378 [Haemaphysalis longicornis]
METLDLGSKRSTRLRSFLARFGHDLEKWVSECGLYDARFDATLQCIEVCGGREAIEKVKNLMRELQAEKDVRPHWKAVEETCSICHLPPQCSTGGDVKPSKVHRMESCGHLHCVPCLTLAVKFAPLPLTCFHPNCGALWVIADVSQVTSDDPELLSTLARRSLNEKLSQSSSISWMPCPTPECVFVWNTRNTATSQGIQVCKGLHICPGCRNPVCFRCQFLFHYGRPCGQQGSDHSTSLEVLLRTIQEMNKLMRQALRGPQEDGIEVTGATQLREVPRSSLGALKARKARDEKQGLLLDVERNLKDQQLRRAQEDGTEVTGATQLREVPRSSLGALKARKARDEKQVKRDEKDLCIIQ